jgi:hypothetical protein
LLALAVAVETHFQALAVAVVLVDLEVLQVKV